MINTLIARVVDLISLAHARKGFEYIADTAAHEGSFHVIEAITDATFTVPGTVSAAGDNLPNALILTAGSRLYGNFSAIKLASGTALAYHS